ncbi:MAG: hypothetical protein JO088_21550 [Acidobacteria bacterium]|nr:hypothetical protein [Acidobacteriota bacterium]
MFRARPGLPVSFAIALILAGALSCKPEPEPAPAKETARYLHDPKWKDAADTLCPGALDAPCAGDIFPGMDGPNLQLTKADISGRLVWNVWVGDTGSMWDYMAQHAFGTADLIKTIDSRRRAHRLAEIGIINQPGFRAAAKPDKYGLFIDEPKPGDPDGQIDTKLDYYTYGRSSGVVGLRISDNPAFVNSKAAQDAWMAHIDKKDGINHAYYEDQRYYTDPALIRPYVVGMACAFCHVSLDPVRPPAVAEEPRWANLNDFVGAQYLKVWEVFVPKNPNNDQSFVWQLIHSNPPGTLDTSFIATDYLNNPGTMNGIYNLAARLGRGAKPTLTKPASPGQEYIAGGALDLLHIQDDIKTGGLTIPRVLKQGDDSVGIYGALSRVYLNIGESWPEWQKHFLPLVGGVGQTPVPVKTLQRTSASWNWSEERAHYLGGYLVKVAKPLLLKDAPNSAKYLKADAATLANGRRVFAENCAGCHSSKKPTDPNATPGSDAAKAWYSQHVNDPDFFTDNFLGDEVPRPVTLIGTNATRAAATNAMRGHIWDNFSSETYKSRAQIGPLTLTNPIDNTTFSYQMQGNGPGYYRPPSLISLWSSAPYLHNNMMGDQPADSTLEGRMNAFQDGIEKMLMLKPRKNAIWRTSAKSYLSIPASYISLAPTLIPKFTPILAKMLKDVDPNAFDANGNLVPPIVEAIKLADPKAITSTGDILIGPIPQGTPINLISNLDLDGAGISPSDPVRGRVIVTKALIAAVKALAEIRDQNMNDAEATARLKLIVPDLLAANKCPDFVEDKGHEFGTKLPTADKRALIELLKTF